MRELKNALERERKSREKDGDSTHARDAEKSELPTIVERKNKQTHTHTHTHKRTTSITAVRWYI